MVVLHSALSLDGVPEVLQRDASYTTSREDRVADDIANDITPSAERRQQQRLQPLPATLNRDETATTTPNLAIILTQGAQ